MPDIKLDVSEHDIIFTEGDFQLTSAQSESLAQRLKIKLQTFQGEFFLDTRVGLPYYQSILRKNVSKASVDAIFLRAISEEPEVLQVNDFRSVLDNMNRIYTLSFTVRSQNDPEPIPIEIQL